MEVKITYRWSREFSLDVAHAGIDDAALDRLRRNIASNPYIGTPVPGDGYSRHYEFSKHIVTYRIVDTQVAEGVVIVWLLRMTPKDTPPPVLMERLSRAVDAYFKIKKVVREIFWKVDEDD